MLRSLIRGILCLFMSYITEDMIKSKNTDFHKMSIYAMKLQVNGKWN